MWREFHFTRLRLAQVGAIGLFLVAVAGASADSVDGQPPVEPVEPRRPGQPVRVVPILPDAPDSLTGYRDRVGESFLFRVTGNAKAGSVYGSGIYTDDSTLAAAVVHDGLLKDGERGIVKVTILSGRENYDAAVRHGINSHAYGTWHGSYRVSKADVPIPEKPSGGRDDILNDPGNMTRFHRQVGDTMQFRVTGSIDGFVWGSGPYISDSDLSTAAVHAGVLLVGETGVVTVTVQPVQYGFPGTERNGVTTRDWLPWDGNYRIERYKRNAK